MFVYFHILERQNKTVRERGAAAGSGHNQQPGTPMSPRSKHLSHRCCFPGALQEVGVEAEQLGIEASLPYRAWASKR